ncbi:MAG: DNA polymerase III subunit chi, partial [Primorskyibacter sp.]
MFYHLVQRSVDRALTELVARSMDRGWRVAIRGTRADHLDWLDKKLWLGPDETFLPHGLAGGPHDALQPVLLTTGAADNAPQVLMAVDGA